MSANLIFTTSWHDLPPEIQEHIISYALESTLQIRLVCHHFNIYYHNLARRFIKHYLTLTKPRDINQAIKYILTYIPSYYKQLKHINLTLYFSAMLQRHNICKTLNIKNIEQCEFEHIKFINLNHLSPRVLIYHHMHLTSAKIYYLKHMGYKFGSNNNNYLNAFYIYTPLVIQDLIKQDKSPTMDNINHTSLQSCHVADQVKILYMIGIVRHFDTLDISNIFLTMLDNSRLVEIMCFELFGHAKFEALCHKLAENHEFYNIRAIIDNIKLMINQTELMELNDHEFIHLAINVIHATILPNYITPQYRNTAGYIMEVKPFNSSQLQRLRQLHILNRHSILNIMHTKHFEDDIKALLKFFITLDYDPWQGHILYHNNFNKALDIWLMLLDDHTFNQSYTIKYIINWLRHSRYQTTSAIKRAQIKLIMQALCQYSFSQDNIYQMVTILLTYPYINKTAWYKLLQHYKLDFAQIQLPTSNNINGHNFDTVRYYYEHKIKKRKP